MSDYDDLRRRLRQREADLRAEMEHADTRPTPPLWVEGCSADLGDAAAAIETLERERERANRELAESRLAVTDYCSRWCEAEERSKNHAALKGGGQDMRPGEGQGDEITTLKKALAARDALLDRARPIVQRALEHATIFGYTPKQDIGTLLRDIDARKP